MKPEERANKVYIESFDSLDARKTIDAIASQIREAVEDAVENIMESPGMKEFIEERERKAVQEALDRDDRKVFASGKAEAIQELDAKYNALAEKKCQEGMAFAFEEAAKIAEPNHKCKPGCCEECKEAYFIADAIRAHVEVKLKQK